MKYLVGVISIIFFGINIFFQDDKNMTDPIQFPVGYPTPSKTVIQQLSTYPLPRYFPSNKLLRLFNWMDPNYMGGQGQEGVNRNLVSNNAINIQRELITNWNYGIVIPNSQGAFSYVTKGTCPPTIKLANDYPSIPLHIISLWLQCKPKVIGQPYKKSLVSSKGLDSTLYIDFDFYGKMKREINFNFPDSLIRIDGRTQKYHISKIISYLTRPIDMINENGEEPPGPYLLEAIKNDPTCIKLKNEMRIESWEDFMAQKKLHMRHVYSSAFMDSIPELKNTKFNFYAVEGGPKDRFEWDIIKKCSDPINGIYYSTPDFYPRWPKNWRYWDGPWHGWEWIETGRKKEIADGDHLFSPFVAAGWSKNQEEDIRPGQWLGLLKCLSVVGAEFYYVGYFSLSAPFTDPAKWTWQAAMPSYAQAITSRFEDVLKNGNVLMDKHNKPIISYKTEDRNMLITVRKHNKKEKYVICGTYQPYSNNAKEIAEKRNTSVTINGESITFEIRRQGSVYIYEKTSEGKFLFYQLDSWHENAHPDHWSKDFYFEAEAADSIVSNNVLQTETKKANDYSDFITSVKVSKDSPLIYNYSEGDSLAKSNYLWIRYKGDGILSINVRSSDRNNLKQDEQIPVSGDWKWHKIILKNMQTKGSENTLYLKLKKGNINLDKFVITTKNSIPEI